MKLFKRFGLFWKKNPTKSASLIPKLQPTLNLGPTKLKLFLKIKYSPHELNTITQILLNLQAQPVNPPTNISQFTFQPLNFSKIKLGPLTFTKLHPQPQNFSKIPFDPKIFWNCIWNPLFILSISQNYIFNLPITICIWNPLFPKFAQRPLWSPKFHF